MLNLSGVECIVNRITYVGELGFEIYIPYNKLSEIFQKLYVKNGSTPIKLAGYHALNSLRMEKGYLHWGHDIGIEENPFEAGVGFCVNFKKESPFLGQVALEEKKGLCYEKKKGKFCFI